MTLLLEQAFVVDAGQPEADQHALGQDLLERCGRRLQANS